MFLDITTNKVNTYAVCIHYVWIQVFCTYMP